MEVEMNGKKLGVKYFSDGRDMRCRRRLMDFHHLTTCISYDMSSMEMRYHLSDVCLSCKGPLKDHEL